MELKAELNYYPEEIKERYISTPFLKPCFRDKNIQKKYIEILPPSFGSHQLIDPCFPRLNSIYKPIRTIYNEPLSSTQIDLVENNLTHSNFILKRVIKSKLLCTEHWNSARREISIHSKLLHPNIVQMQASGEAPEEFLLLLEYIPSADYFVESLEVNNEPFMLKRDGGISKLQSFCFDILQGLKYLHSLDIVHLDIKPGNLMLEKRVGNDDYPVVKIGDFGLARNCERGGVRLPMKCGTEHFMAPEVRSGGWVTCKADMWSFGIFLHLLVVGYTPSALNWRPGTKLPIFKRHWRKYEGKGLFGLIEQCLALEPYDRLSAEEALQHEWFRAEPGH